MADIDKLECPHCNGWGFIDSDVSQQCQRCAGTGRLRRIDYKNNSSYFLTLVKRAQAKQYREDKKHGTIRNDQT